MDMYSAIINSPSTTLATGINDIQTNIEVVDGNVILTAPNLITIGYDTQTPETILVTVKNGNIFTVTRGFEGTAQSWTSGAKCARVFTAYDHNSLKQNVESLTNYEKYVSVDFGSTGQETYVLANVTDFWISSTSKISASIVCETTSDRSPEDFLVENMSVGISDITNGSCNLHCHAPNGAIGVYRIILTGR